MKASRRRRILFVLVLASTQLLGAIPTVGHAPLTSSETGESLAEAVVIEDPLKSWVLYEELHEGGEVRYYAMELDAGDRLTVTLFIPRAEKDEFLPSLVLMGPGLNGTGEIPAGVEVPNASGTLLVPGRLPTQAGYEPFTPASYYYLLDVDTTAPQHGLYYLAVYESTSGGKYGLAVGYREEFTAEEWILLPFSLVSIRLWEGQSVALIFAPLLLTLLIGLGFLFWKRRRLITSVSGLTGSLAGLLFIGTGAMTLVQTAYALSVAASGSAVLSLAFGIIPIVLGVVLLRQLARSSETLSFKSRAIIAACGLGGLLVWAGLVAGPVLAFLTAVLPFRKM